MKTKALSATQIDILVQRLSQTPVAARTSAKKTGDALARLLAARIGDERAAIAFTSIMTADTFEQADARLTLVLNYGSAEPVAGAVPAAVKEPKAATALIIPTALLIDLCP